MMQELESAESASLFDHVTARIKEERLKRKISQLKLALILGHNSTSYVARIELRQNGANYNLLHIYTIAKEFGMQMGDFLPSIESE
jgi:transcriptional regulator with XRE-family HTH domain